MSFFSRCLKQIQVCRWKTVKRILKKARWKIGLKTPDSWFLEAKIRLTTLWRRWLAVSYKNWNKEVQSGHRRSVNFPAFCWTSALVARLESAAAVLETVRTVAAVGLFNTLHGETSNHKFGAGPKCGPIHVGSCGSGPLENALYWLKFGFVEGFFVGSHLLCPGHKTGTKTIVVMTWG